MKLRSLLFVPADSDRKSEKARGAGADALILDLEDSVAPDRKAAARDALAARIDEASAAPRDWSFWVRVNAFETDLTEADLAAVVRPGLDGIMLPKCSGGKDIVRLGAMLDEMEKKAGMERGATRILPVATETPQAVFALGSYAPAHPRLAGLTWGAEDLSAAIGATANKESDGSWTAPYQMVRSLTLMGASAADVPAIDTLFADFRDTEGLEADCRRARRDGFVGRLAIHPAQIEPIHRGFAPGPEELALARRIVAAFDADPDLGTVGIDGKMYDIPHLKQARRTIASASE